MASRPEPGSREQNPDDVPRRPGFRKRNSFYPPASGLITSILPTGLRGFFLHHPRQRAPQHPPRPLPTCLPRTPRRPRPPPSNARTPRLALHLALPPSPFFFLPKTRPYLLPPRVRDLHRRRASRPSVRRAVLPSIRRWRGPLDGLGAAAGEAGSWFLHVRAPTVLCPCPAVGA